MASIIQRPNGKYRARYRDEAGKEHARHFDLKKDAQKWLNEVTASVVTGTYVDPIAGKITFDAYFKEWASRQVWVEGTETAADLVRRTVSFGAVPLAQLRPSHIESWVKNETKRGLQASTLKTRLGTVKACLKAAVRDRRMAVDPSYGIKPPRARRAQAAMVVPTAAEVGALIEACEPYRRPLILLAAFGGLRPGETLGVQVSAIDFLRRELHVVRQIQDKRGGGVRVVPPKYGSERDVYPPDRILTEFARHIETFGTSAEGWLVAGENGAMLPGALNIWWGKLRIAAGVRSTIRMHDLRHFYASGLIAAGCDVVTVQRALGHSNASTTLNTYSHLWPKAEDRTRKAAAGLFDESWNPADSLRTAEES